MEEFVFNDEGVDLISLPDLPIAGDAVSIDELLQSVKDLRDEPGVEFPALLLSGVLFRDSLEVLKSAKRESYRSVDLWVENSDGGYVHIGDIQLDSKVLLLLRFLRISATMYYDKERVEVLNLNDPEVIERVI